MKKLIVSSCLIIILLSGCNQNIDNNIDKSNEKINQELENQLNGISQPLEQQLIQNQDLIDQEENASESGSDSAKKSEALSEMAIIKTNFGNIKIRFYIADAPKTVQNFIKLAKSDFYDNVKFHRVMKDFMIQTGDPNSKDDNWTDDGTGGPDYTFEDEINSHKLVRGSVAMANRGPNTNGSQFFIVTTESTPWLDGDHTNFGEVVEGMEVVEKIENIPVNEIKHPLQDAIINDIEIVE